MTCPCANMTKTQKMIAGTGLGLALLFGGWFGAYKAGWVSNCCPIACCVEAVSGGNNP